MPAEWVAAGRGAVGLGLPRELERARRVRVAASIRAARGRRAGQLLGQLAGALELGAPLVGLRPEEVGRRGDLGRLVEHPDRVAEVVERRSPGAR